MKLFQQILLLFHLLLDATLLASMKNIFWSPHLFCRCSWKWRLLRRNFKEHLLLFYEPRVLHFKVSEQSNTFAWCMQYGLVITYITWRSCRCYPNVTKTSTDEEDMFVPRVCTSVMASWTSDELNADHTVFQCNTDTCSTSILFTLSIHMTFTNKALRFCKGKSAGEQCPR